MNANSVGFWETIEVEEEDSHIEMSDNWNPSTDESDNDSHFEGEDESETEGDEFQTAPRTTAKERERKKKEDDDISSLMGRIQQHCTCTDNDVDKKCYKSFTVHELQVTRKNLFSLNKSDRRRILMMSVFMNCELNGSGEYYVVRGKKLCKKVWLLLCSMLGSKLPRTQTISDVKREMQNHQTGIMEIPIQFGGRLQPQSDLQRSTSTKNAVISFLDEEYTNAMDLPDGRRHKRARSEVDQINCPDKPTVRVLPCVMNMTKLFKKMKKELEDDGSPIKLIYRTFVRNFISYPFLQLNTRYTDYCDYCFFMKNLIQYETDDVIKENLQMAITAHIAEAKKERDEYNRQIEFDTPGTTHISFDMAASCSIPRLQVQVGSLYFKCEFKVRIFGICQEKPDNNQVNYLMPEGTYPKESAKGGKGANLIISLLHHHLHEHPSEKKLLIHADSCGGQNKNQYMFNYLILLVHTGKVDEVMISFMIPGHTKFRVDANFGNCKRAYFQEDICTVKELQEAFDTVPNNSTVNCMEAEEHGLSFYDFKKYLSACFNDQPPTHPGSRVIARFHCKKDEHGSVIYSVSNKSDQTEIAWMTPNTILPVLQLPKLSEYKEARTPISTKRQKQLLEIGDKYILPQKKEEYFTNVARIFAQDWEE